MNARFAPGTLLADTYRVIRLVGVGGMGEVYEASHDRLPGRYAIKVLLGEIVGRTEIIQRFRREAEVTSGLRHPNIVQVLDFNVTPEGYPYLVMEYLEGVELADEIRRVGPMPIARVLDIIGQIASGLAAAHSHQVVHRDLKPQNMFLVRLPGSDREAVKMVDFGISKVREATTQLTLEQAILGTPQYMAPEQALGRLSEISDRTDQFALAAITYELLTGRPAFAADSVPSILFQVVHQQPDPITKLAPTVGRTVEAVVFKALSKAQEDRYPSVLSFHAALVQAATADYPISPMDTPAPVWLPQGYSQHGIPGNVSGGLSLVAPTAELQPVAATALLEPTSQKVPTTLRAAAASFESEPVRKASSRRWPIWTSALVVAAGLAGLGTWQVSRSRLPASPFPVIEPRAKVTPPAPTTARIDIKNAPPGLIVSIDGVVTDLPILLPAGYDVHTIFFEAPGYKSTEMHVDGSEPRALVLAMKPVSATDQPMADDETASSARKTHARKAHKSAHHSQ